MQRRVWLEKSMNFCWRAPSCHKLWGKLGLWRSMPCMHLLMHSFMQHDWHVQSKSGCLEENWNERESLSHLMVWVKICQYILVEIHKKLLGSARFTPAHCSSCLSTWIYLVPRCTPSHGLASPTGRVWCLTGHQHWQVWSKWGKIHRSTCFKCTKLDCVQIDLDSISILNR